MPRYVYVQLAGCTTTTPRRIPADHAQVDEPRNRVVLMKGEYEVGEFRSSDVIGWWVQDEPE